MVFGFQLAAGVHPVGQRHQRPGGLLGALPVPFGAVAHQPAYGVGIERVFRIDLAERRQHDGGGAGIGVPVPAVDFFLFPMGPGGRKDRLAGKIRQQRIQARVARVDALERLRQEGLRVDRHPLALVVKLHACCSHPAFRVRASTYRINAWRLTTCGSFRPG